MEYDFNEALNRAGSFSTNNKNHITADVFSSSTDRADILSSWVSNMDFNIPPHIITSIDQRTLQENKIFGYPFFLSQNSKLIKNFQDWYQRRHNFAFNASQLQVCSHVEMSITTVMKLKSKKKQGIVVLTPIDSMIIHQIKVNSRICVQSKLLFNAEEQQYQINFNELEAILKQENNTIMIFNNPCCPSGRVWTHQEVQKVATLCLQNNVYLISNEIDADLTQPEIKHTVTGSLSDEINKNTATILTPTKQFNLRGFAVSTIIFGDEAISNQFLFKNLALGHFFPNTFAINTLENCFSEQGEQWLTALLAYLKQNFELVESTLKAKLANATVHKMQAGFQVALDFTQIGMNSREIQAAFEEKKLQCAQLNTFFEPAEESSLFLLNIATPREKLLSLLNDIVSTLSIKLPSYSL